MLHKQRKANKYGETKEARYHQFDHGGSGSHRVSLRSPPGHGNVAERFYHGTGILAHVDEGVWKIGSGKVHTWTRARCSLP